MQFQLLCMSGSIVRSLQRHEEEGSLQWDQSNAWSEGQHLQLVPWCSSRHHLA